MTAADELIGQTSSGRSWGSSSVREMWNDKDIFQGSSFREVRDDEEELRCAIERLPNYNRMRNVMLRQVASNGRVVLQQVDITRLGYQEKMQLMESILKEDNEKFLWRLGNRIDRVGIDIPKIEARFENLSVEGDAYIGTRALPTLLNTTLNALEVSGKVTYCGHELSEFVPQRTSAYISQHDVHYGQMNVRETFNFSGRCLGVGTRYDMLAELSRREKESGVKPDPEIDAYMKATAMAGQETSLITDYVLKILGLDICAGIIVGDNMTRGISGGQKKRVTTGEMLVGPAKAFFMDEISTGLDSSTTIQTVEFLRQMVHIMDATMVISLLQPAPEVFQLFDDVILLSEGQIVYQGPRENVLEFFEHMGFKCPDRKGVADFLQEVTSKMDRALLVQKESTL